MSVCLLTGSMAQKCISVQQLTQALRHNNLFEDADVQLYDHQQHDNNKTRLEFFRRLALL